MPAQDHPDALEATIPVGRRELDGGRAAEGGALRLVPDAALVDLLEHHHGYARRALTYIVPLLAKVACFHAKRNEKLAALRDACEELADTLEEHLDEEERALFPALLAAAPRPEVLRREVEAMSRHHRELVLLLDVIRSLADGYRAPEWAGRSYRVLMEELAGLADDLRQHMDLENRVLIPRLLARG